MPALWQGDRMAVTGSCGVRPAPADVSLTPASFKTHRLSECPVHSGGGKASCDIWAHCLPGDVYRSWDRL